VSSKTGQAVTRRTDPIDGKILCLFYGVCSFPLLWREQWPHGARPDTKRSPFNCANSLKTPIFPIHGMNDDNSGTFPINSDWLFAALKGNGGTVRYVQLALEHTATRRARRSGTSRGKL